MIKNVTAKILEEVLPKTLKSTKKVKVTKTVKDTLKPFSATVFLRRSSSDITPASCSKQTKNNSGCSCAVYGNKLRYDQKDEEYVLNLIFFAIQYKNTELLQQICEQSRMNMNVLNEDGVSPLHFSAIVGSVECIDILKQHGACLNMRDVRGQIPMYYYKQQLQHPEATSAY